MSSAPHSTGCFIVDRRGDSFSVRILAQISMMTIYGAAVRNFRHLRASTLRSGRSGARLEDVDVEHWARMLTSTRESLRDSRGLGWSLFSVAPFLGRSSQLPNGSHVGHHWARSAPILSLQAASTSADSSLLASVVVDLVG